MSKKSRTKQNKLKKQTRQPIVKEFSGIPSGGVQTHIKQVFGDRRQVVMTSDDFYNYLDTNRHKLQVNGSRPTEDNMFTRGQTHDAFYPEPEPEPQ